MLNDDEKKCRPCCHGRRKSREETPNEGHVA
jgi:hypothetical protein